MGRKSLATERRAQILEAFSVCLRQHGLEGCTLERVAQEAGVQRSIIRHYIGNRDDLVTAAVEHIIGDYVSELVESFNNLPQADRVPALLDYLFSPETGSEIGDFDILINALWASHERDPHTRSLLLDLHLELESLIDGALRTVYPGAESQRRRDTAYSLLCLFDSTWSLASLGFPQSRFAAARRTAEQLINSLAVE